MGTNDLTRARASGDSSLIDWLLDSDPALRWQYSVLNAAEYFRAASLVDSIAPDQRMVEAIDVIGTQRQLDGTWLQGGRSQGRQWFEIEAEVGQPSKWLTLSATRVLKWWGAGSHS